MVNLGPIALFGNFKLTTSSGKLLKDITHAHLVSLLYKMISSAKDTNDLNHLTTAVREGETSWLVIET